MASFELGNLILEPGRYVVCFNILFNMEAAYEPGILATLSKIFSSRRISILSIKTTLSKEENAARLTLFVDFTRREKLLKEVANVIRSLKHVRDVKVIEPLFNGSTADTAYNNLTFIYDRAVIFGKPIYEGLIKGVREKFGNAGKVFLYHIGFIIGQKMYENMSEFIKKVHGGIKESLLFSKELFRQVGFGIVETLEINYLNKTALVRVYNSFECELFKGSKTTESYLIRGLIAGYMSSFFGTRVNALETKCIAKGDPYCEFTIQ